MGVLDPTAAPDVVAGGASWSALMPSLLTSGATSQQEHGALPHKTPA